MYIYGECVVYKVIIGKEVPIPQTKMSETKNLSGAICSMLKDYHSTVFPLAFIVGGSSLIFHTILWIHDKVNVRDATLEGRQRTTAIVAVGESGKLATAVYLWPITTLFHTLFPPVLGQAHVIKESK